MKNESREELHGLYGGICSRCANWFRELTGVIRDGRLYKSYCDQCMKWYDEGRKHE